METRLLGGGVNLNNRHPLRLNVGFLLHENVGYSRKFEFDYPAVQVADDLDITTLTGSLRLTRTGQGLYADGRLQAASAVECVRCLTPFQQPLGMQLSELFVYPPDLAADPLLAVPETGLLDLSPIVREYLLLDLPLQPVCRPECLGLCPECGNNRNEALCQHPELDIDPRLASLKNLLTNS